MNRYLTKLTVCKLGGGYKFTYLLTKSNIEYKIKL